MAATRSADSGRVDKPEGDPLCRLAFILSGKPLCARNPEHIEPRCDMVDFNARPDAPGLYKIGLAVRASSRKTVLPPAMNVTRSGTN
jgi:hypothetical protein